MDVSEGGTLDEKKKITVSDPEKDSVIEAFNEIMNPVDEAVKASKFKDALEVEEEEKEDDPTDEVIEEEEEKEEEPDPIPVKKSKFAQSLEKTYIKEK